MKMPRLSQEAFVEMLKVAWGHIQDVHRETGVLVEVRLAATGLVAMGYDQTLGFGHTAIAGWHEMAQSGDLRSLLLAKITEAAERVKLQAHPSGPQQVDLT